MRQRRAPVPITARQIDTFRRELTQRECSPGTVENYIRSVRAFARWNREAPCDTRLRRGVEAKPCGNTCPRHCQRHAGWAE